MVSGPNTRTPSNSPPRAAAAPMLAGPLPNATVTVLDDVGHEPFIESPAETFAAIRGFLVATQP